MLCTYIYHTCSVLTSTIRALCLHLPHVLCTYTIAAILMFYHAIVYEIPASLCSRATRSVGWIIFILCIPLFLSYLSHRHPFLFLYSLLPHIFNCVSLSYHSSPLPLIPFYSSSLLFFIFSFLTLLLQFNLSSSSSFKLLSIWHTPLLLLLLLLLHLLHLLLLLINIIPVHSTISIEYSLILKRLISPYFTP